MFKEGYFSICKNSNELDIYQVVINMDYINDIINLLLNDKNSIINHYENIDEKEFLKFNKKDIINLKEKACVANKCITINDKTFGTKYLFVKSLKSFDLLDKDASTLYNLLTKIIKNEFQYIPKIIDYKSQNSYIDKYYDMVNSIVVIKYIETRNIDELKKEMENAKKLVKKNSFILKGVK